MDSDICHDNFKVLNRLTEVDTSVPPDIVDVACVEFVLNYILSAKAHFSSH